MPGVREAELYLLCPERSKLTTYIYPIEKNAIALQVDSIFNIGNLNTNDRGTIFKYKSTIMHLNISTRI